MSSAPQTDTALRLAAVTSASTYDAFSAATVDAALDVLFDTLACAYGGLRAPGVAEAREAFSAWGPGRATIWGTGRSAPGPFAAVANGGALHALDYDDTDDKVPLHAASVVLPALLADLEENRPDCTAEDFLTALIVGLDGAMRLGRAGGPKGSRGWNYSVISGGIGAALAVSRLRGWDVRETVHLLGHQLAQTSGSLQSIIDGTLAKRFQPAVVAKDVLFGAALTAVGIDGPRAVFDGRAGFANLYQDGSFDREVLLDGAETAAYLTDLSLKPYPACRFTHAPIDLALDMRAAGVRADQVERIVFEVSGQAVNMVGRTYAPSSANTVDAQFCIGYTTSVALHRGEVLIGDFLEPALRDPVVGGFAAERVEVVAAEGVDFLSMAPVSARVAFTDGSERAFGRDTVSGSPEERMSPDRLRAKAQDCLSHGQAPVTVEKLWDAVQSLRAGAPMSRLTTVLAKGSEEGDTDV